MKSIKFFLLIFVLGSFNIYAQQLPNYSQYRLNAFIYNPAIAGSDGYTSFHLTARQNWLGFKGAPRTYFVCGQTRFLKSDIDVTSGLFGKKKIQTQRSGRVGIGGFAYNDVNGRIHRTGAQFAYAYHIPLDVNQLSLGISVTGFQYKIDELTRDDFDDAEPLLENLDKTTFVFPDFNIGVQYLTSNFYAGVAVNQLFQSFIKIGGEGYKEHDIIRHYYVNGAYLVRFSETFILEPSILARGNEKNGLLATDIGMKLHYQENYWAGLAYRTNQALIVLFGLKFDNYYLGYAFDYPFTSISQHSFGTHEFLIGVRIGSGVHRYKWKERF